MEILVQVEAVIGCECRLSCELALAVLIVTAYLPHRIAAVKVITYIVRNIRDEELRLLDWIAFPSLHAVVVQFAFNS